MIHLIYLVLDKRVFIELHLKHSEFENMAIFRRLSYFLNAKIVKTTHSKL